MMEDGSRLAQFAGKEPDDVALLIEPVLDVHGASAGDFDIKTQELAKKASFLLDLGRAIPEAELAMSEGQYRGFQKYAEGYLRIVTPVVDSWISGEGDLTTVQRTYFQEKMRLTRTLARRNLYHEMAEAYCVSALVRERLGQQAG